jgi:hypothetical protein
MLGDRLKKADEIARRRAKKLADSVDYTPEELARLSRYNTKERLHREPSRRDMGQLRKSNSTCDCEMCRVAKGKRAKGESKRQRALELESGLDRRRGKVGRLPASALVA